MTFLIAMPQTTVRVYLIDLTSTQDSICGPAARKKKKEARDTLALPAEGEALCTPSKEGGEGHPRAPGRGRSPLHSQL